VSGLRTLCVFSGSSMGADPAYGTLAAALGEAAVARRLRIVYGGAHVGLMGAVADAALAAGGEVVGVIPEHMVEHEVAHRGLTELHVVSSMHERKALMADLSDGFMALPGGLGTTEELTEILTWAQLGLHHKPIALLDCRGFFAGLLGFLDHALQEGFVRPGHRALLLCGTDPGAVLDEMAALAPRGATGRGGRPG
jgi:uncharacterized protein (TIGR00730 family)